MANKVEAGCRTGPHPLAPSPETRGGGTGCIGRWWSRGRWLALAVVGAGLVLSTVPVHSDPEEALMAWARPKVVLVYLETGGPPRWGTGFVAARGRVITNEHVVRGARAVTIW